MKILGTVLVWASVVMGVWGFFLLNTALGWIALALILFCVGANLMDRAKTRAIQKEYGAPKIEGNVLRGRNWGASIRER